MIFPQGIIAVAFLLLSVNLFFGVGYFRTTPFVCRLPPVNNGWGFSISKAMKKIFNSSLD
jgi:hypothetical protein